MLFLAIITLLVGLATASTNPLTDFLLVTTSSPYDFRGNVATMPDVNATSLFDPFSQPSYNLRLIGPGYGSLPCFNLSHGFLYTQAAGPHGKGEYRYWNVSPTKGTPLKFSIDLELGGSTLSLEKGFLLAVDGETEGWTVCEGELGQQVLAWKAEGESCVKRYVQAVKQAPY